VRGAHGDGDHRHHGLALEADHVAREHGLVLGVRAEEAGADIAQVVAGDDREHAGRGGRGGGLDA
jgi:hypothetical protein